VRKCVNNVLPLSVPYKCPSEIAFVLWYFSCCKVNEGGSVCPIVLSAQVDCPDVGSQRLLRLALRYMQKDRGFLQTTLTNSIYLSDRQANAFISFDTGLRFFTSQHRGLIVVEFHGWKGYMKRDPGANLELRSLSLFYMYCVNWREWNDAFKQMFLIKRYSVADAKIMASASLNAHTLSILKDWVRMVLR
jgi:hypothetical protein